MTSRLTAPAGAFSVHAPDPQESRARFRRNVAMAKDESRWNGGPFTFKVSDSLEVPLRGHLLRLRLSDGTPRMDDLKVGRKLRIVSPSGKERTVTILGHAATGGRATQGRLQTTRELDIVIPSAEAGAYDDRIGIGWRATGPVS
jgi:hypothetical protein